MKVLLALLGKEIHLAFRSKQMVGLGLSLALAFSVALSFPLASESLSPKVVSVLIWAVLFFSSADQAYRTFLREEETGTADQLRLRVPSGFVFISKVASNAVLLVIIGVASSTLLSVWLRIEMGRFWIVLLSVAGGSVCLALSQGAVGFLLGFGKGGGAFYPLVVMPIILPVLVSLILITASCIEGATVSGNLVLVVCALSGAILAGGLTILPFVEV
jgi:ABC-type transport system involved in cytochrome c biogenesis permease component